jgi:LmbE family N-acetylglucosaminyl deacetylase
MKTERSNLIPQSAMVIIAHPDDAEFTCAGTVAAWAKAGCNIAYVLCTDGNCGSHEPGMTRRRLAEIRRQEQRRACQTLGVEQVVFLGHDDGTLQLTLELRRQLVGAIRQHKPQVVITEDPTVLFYEDDYINHPDHRAAGQAALDAVAPACELPLLWPEMGAPHRVKQVYVFGSNDPNCWVDTSQTVELKITALKQHASQMGDWDPSEMTRERDAKTGKAQGVAFAEEFRLITLRQPEGED